MAYSALSLFLVVIALLVVLAAGKLLFSRSWFFGWLRGMSGILLFVVAAMVCLAGVDLYSYRQLNKEETIATISFKQESTQQFSATLVDSAGNDYRYRLSGDLWQLDARLLRWNTSLAALGLSPGYRLDRLSGRYLSLEDEYNAERTVYDLNKSKSMFDIWTWLRSSRQFENLIDANYGSATYLPMSDGALFSVKLTPVGLAARPLNERAQSAVSGWE